MSNNLYFKGLGIASAIFLSGTFFGSSQLTIPTLLGRDTAQTTAIFAHFYHRGLVTIVPLVVLCTSVSAYLAYTIPAQRNAYLVAVAAPLATQPFTTFVMMGTIKALLALAEADAERTKVGPQGVDALLKRWAAMNFVRSALAFVGGIAGLYAIRNELGAL